MIDQCCIALWSQYLTRGCPQNYVLETFWSAHCTNEKDADFSFRASLPIKAMISAHWKSLRNQADASKLEGIKRSFLHNTFKRLFSQSCGLPPLPLSLPCHLRFAGRNPQELINPTPWLGTFRMLEHLKLFLVIPDVGEPVPYCLSIFELLHSQWPGLWFDSLASYLWHQQKFVIDRGSIVAPLWNIY